MLKHSQESKLYRLNNPGKARAHSLVANRVRSGSLIPQPCEKCGTQKTEAHHEDYSKPLEVNWLCKSCHNSRHAEIRAAAGFIPAKYVPNGRRAAKKNTDIIFKAREMKSSGASYNLIGKSLGVSKGTAYKWINSTEYN